MHSFDSKVPMKEWAGVLESMARELRSMADYLFEVSEKMHESEDVRIKISEVVKEAVSLLHEMPEVPGKPRVLGILVHLEELFGLPKKIDGEIQEALGLVHDMPEAVNKRKLVDILDRIKYLLVEANGEHLR